MSVHVTLLTRVRSAHGGAREIGVVGAIGLALIAVLLIFNVMAAPAAAAGPTIVAYSPPVGSLHMSPLTKPWVKFSEQIDAATLTSATFFMTKQGATAKVAAGFESGPALNTWKVAPFAPLEGGVVYEVTVTAGIKDLDDEALSTPWSWTFQVEADQPPDVFVDVQPGSPYYDAIQGLYQAGVVDGKDGPVGREFGPEDPIWRQQFAKMIVGALALTVTEDMTSPFTDLGPDNPSNLYPHEYVAAAYANAITTGITATSFGPYREITRAQVVTMGVRALESLHGGALAAPSVGYQNTWGTGFSSIHGPKARVAEYNGLLDGLGADAAHPTGDLAGLDPWGVMPRGEVAQFLWNVMVLLP